MKNFTFNEHIKKHTQKENTYNENCIFCNPNIKNESHNRFIEKDLSKSNIKPLSEINDLSTVKEKQKFKEIIKEFNKNLKDLGLK